MKVTINKPTDYEAAKMEVFAAVRYWEDSEINGIEDTEDGDNIPCKNGENWCPVINIDTGVIENWEKGKIANIHYKVVDRCSFGILDDKGEVIFKQENDYVPLILCPKENGYGDYIIMDISEGGVIQDWNKHALFELLSL